MSISRRSKAIFVMTLLVLVSLFAGFVLGAAAAKGVAKRKENPRFWKQAAMKQLNRLRPEEEQRKQFEKRVDQAVEELTTLRRESVSRAEAIVANAVRDIEKDLTPEQRQTFDKIKPKPKAAEAE